MVHHRRAHLVGRSEYWDELPGAVLTSMLEGEPMRDQGLADAFRPLPSGSEDGVQPVQAGERGGGVPLVELRVEAGLVRATKNWAEAKVGESAHGR